MLMKDAKDFKPATHNGGKYLAIHFEEEKKPVAKKATKKKDSKKKAED